MKKFILIIFSLILFIGLIACSNKKESNSITVKEQSNIIVKERDVREIVWNQLTSKNKDRVKGSWRYGKLSKITLNENMGIINDKSYIGKEVYVIDFPTKNISMPNNMIVFASSDNYKIIGYGYVE